MIWLKNPESRRCHYSKRWNEKDNTSIPLSVADLDIKPPHAVQKALIDEIRHGVYGYTIEPSSFKENWTKHIFSRYNWEINPDWIIAVPGVIPGVTAAIRCFPQKTHLIRQIPVYHQIHLMAKRMGLEDLTIPVQNYFEKRMIIDFKELENKMKNFNSKSCLLFCNPWNPGGTVFKKQEIQKISTLALETKTPIISDEIWCDLILERVQHEPFGKYVPANFPSVTLMAASKTFNIAGLPCAIAIVPKSELRLKLKRELLSYPAISLLAYRATEESLKTGKTWINNLLRALKTNRNTLNLWGDKHQNINIYSGQATYLGWIRSNHESKQLVSALLKFGLHLSPGNIFGDNNAVRINFGCSPDILRKALQRFDSTLKHLNY